MSPKTFVAAAVVTAVTFAAAVAAVVTAPGASQVARIDVPAFPELNAQPNAVAKIVIENGEGKVTLAREGERGWIAPDRAGYPVAGDLVGELVAGLADMRLVERKTAMPERFARLQVEDIDAGDAQSRLVRLEAEDGTVLAEAIIGKRVWRQIGDHRTRTYLRRPNEQQAWLAAGGVTVHETVGDWLAEDIVDIEPAAVARVEVDPAEGEGYVAERPEKGKPLALAAAPKGRAQDEGASGTLEEMLRSVTLSDVKPAKEMTMPEARDVARVRTFEGVEVTVESAKLGDDRWATFSAAYVGDQADQSDAAKAARKKVEEIAGRTGGWAYKLPSHIANRLTTPLEDLLADKEQEENKNS